MTGTDKRIKEKNKALQAVNNLGVWLVVLGMFILLSIVSDKFLQKDNLINLIRQIAVTGITALGATFIILSGEIDLSSGSMIALMGCVSAALMMKAGLSVAGSFVLTLLIGALIGILMGLTITKLCVPSFITTLGMQYVLQGAVLLLTNSKPITNLPEGFLALGRGYIGSIPIPAIIMLFVFIVGAFVLKYTKFGRNVLAVGENRNGARLSGISVNRVKITVFGVGGLLSALGGIVLAARLSSGQPTSGSDVTLQALAAVYVGGSTNGSIMTTLAVALIIGMITNGLNLLEVNAYWQKVVLGIIIIVAVAFDILRSLKAEGKK